MKGEKRSRRGVARIALLRFLSNGSTHRVEAGFSAASGMTESGCNDANEIS